MTEMLTPEHLGWPGGRVPDWLTSTPIAHRGLHDLRADAPENSLAAFERAVTLHCPIELDVRLSADGQVMVFHDKTLMRMTGAVGRVCEHAWPAMRGLTLAGTKEHIPLLSDVLALVNGRVPLLIELKNNGRAGVLELAVWALLRSYQGPYAVQSFNPLSIIWFKRHAPQAVRGQLAGLRARSVTQRVQAFVFNHMLLNVLSRPHFIAYNLTMLPNKKVEKLRGAGVPNVGWTARDCETLARCQDQVDNVIFEGACANTLYHTTRPEEDTQ